MKKFIGVVLVLGLCGGAGWYIYKNHISAEGRTCSKLTELCGDRSKDSSESCEENLEQYKKMVGEASFDKAVACVDEAKSCMGAAGCMVGGGMGGLGQFLQGMVKGLQPELDKAGEALKKHGDKLRDKVIEEVKKSVDELD